MSMRVKQVLPSASIKQNELVALQPLHFGYGFYFRPLHDYKNGILKNRAEVLLFEYLLSMGEYYLKQGYACYYHSYATINKWTGLAPKTARAIVVRFVSEGFLTTRLGHVNGSETTFFTINYAGITCRIKDLYGGLEVKHPLAQRARIIQRKHALRAMLKMYLQIKKQRRTNSVDD